MAHMALICSHRSYLQIAIQIGYQRDRKASDYKRTGGNQHPSEAFHSSSPYFGVVTWSSLKILVKNQPHPTFSQSRYRDTDPGFDDRILGWVAAGNEFSN